MPDSVAPSAAASRRPSLPTARQSMPASRRSSITIAAASASPTHSSHQTTPSLSRKPSITASVTAASSTSNPTPARSRSQSVSKPQQQQQQSSAAAGKLAQHLPPYIHFINSYNPSPSPPQSTAAAHNNTNCTSSPFLSSPLYTLTPHETSLLFQHYTPTSTVATATTPHHQPPHTSPLSPTASHSLTRTEFSTLLIDWLHQLKRKGTESELATVPAAAAAGGGGSDAVISLDGVNALMDSLIASGTEIADTVFRMLDTNQNERIERDEFKLFLATVDAVVGGRIRAEWKRAIIVPRLRAVAAL